MDKQHKENSTEILNSRAAFLQALFFFFIRARITTNAKVQFLSWLASASLTSFSVPELISMLIFLRIFPVEIIIQFCQWRYLMVSKNR